MKLPQMDERKAQGMRIARAHPRLPAPASAPHEYTAACDGLLIARHVPGLIATGDCLAVIADDYVGG